MSTIAKFFSSGPRRVMRSTELLNLLYFGHLPGRTSPWSSMITDSAYVLVSS